VMSVLSFRNFLIGILATLTMDVLSAATIKLRLIAPLSRHLVGRWFASVAGGQPFHTNISSESAINREVVIAVSVHYAIGVALAFLYLGATSALGLNTRNPITAFGFALCTNILPWFVMFPAMGFGWFGNRGPAGTRLFTSSLVAHFFYGVGLWLGVSVLH